MRQDELMLHKNTPRSMRPFGYVRRLRQQEELPLLRDHLLRLDRDSRHDRFNAFMSNDFIERYAAKCADDETVILAYFENGVVRGAAELHLPDDFSPDSLPEVAFSVETFVRRQGVGSILFKRVIAEARTRGYQTLRITTGAQNQPMRALANKFGADLTFRHGESTGNIDLKQDLQAQVAPFAIALHSEAARAMMNFNRTCWNVVLRIYGFGRAA